MRSRLHDLVATTATVHGERPALTYKDTTITYDELWKRVEGVARGLHRLGLQRGERVAVYLDKRIETVASVLGVSLAGGVFVPVNPLLRAKQVGYLLADCAVRVLVTSRDRHELLRSDSPDSPTTVEHVVLADSDWESFADSVSSEPVPDPGTVDVDVAAIFYTSGSTGKPKGVVLSHRNLVVGAESVSSYLGNDQGDVILAALPLSFDAGFSQLTTAFAVGAHVVLMNYVLASDVVRLCARHRVTGLTCVPPLWLQLADQNWPSEATATLRYFANTGGRMPRSTLTRLRTVFPQAQPFLMYGLTEAFRSTYLDPAEVDRRPDSIGKAIPNAEVLVVRPDGSLCDPGEQGELVHRGALVAMGYWNDPERTAERYRPMPGAAMPASMQSGLCVPEMAVWSGDLVVRDADGFLYFVGRNDEMIKTSGYRVSPTEIEEVVYDTHLVRDAVAFGLDDEQLGQHVALVVSAVGGEIDQAALLAELKHQLPLYMVPRQVFVRDELPRSPNGKFDRTLIRKQVTESVDSVSSDADGSP